MRPRTATYATDPPDRTGASSRPLGLRPDAPVAGDALRILQSLEDFDLAPVRQRLLDHGIMPSRWVDDAIKEFRRYLGLCIISDQPLTMFSPQVDAVWHTCLLHSRLYANLCAQSFGYFIHHEPASTPEPDPQAAWQRFEAAYRSLYGEPGRLWQMHRPPRSDTMGAPPREPAPDLHPH